MLKGKLASFSKPVYSEFFFPAFLRYEVTYRTHVLMAGLWLLTGTFNLRNRPGIDLNVLAKEKTVRYLRHTLHRLSGYLYVYSGFLKGITASLMAIYSHSLANAVRGPMVLFGLWDCYSLVVAFQKIAAGDVAGHKDWMIRNFSVGAGSIWVRGFAAVWAALDLSFMEDADLYRKMNNVVLMAGFSFGPLFGEWWVSRTPERRARFASLMLMTCIATAYAARRQYTNETKGRKGDKLKQ